MSKRLGLLCIVCVCSALGGYVGTALPFAFNGTANALSLTGEIRPSNGQALSALSDRFEEVSKLVSPAVVYVEARKQTRSAPNGATQTVEESGSGVIVRANGRQGYLVLTNCHVIADAPRHSILVQLADGRVLTPDRVWTDSESDIALLGLGDQRNLPAAAMGDSHQLRVGNWVLAIGSPFGLNQTVTHGILSARGRGQVHLGGTIRIKDFLQTDAAINPGSSGGPLVNMNGEVVGINTAIASPNGHNSGVAFSIPINMVKEIMNQLLTTGSVSRGYLGIQLDNQFEPGDALRVGLERGEGALVEAVFPNTPGSEAGLQVGDVILSVDGTSIQDGSQLINYVSKLPVGKRVPLEVWRARSRHTLHAVIGDWSKGKEKLR